MMLHLIWLCFWMENFENYIFLSIIVFYLIITLFNHAYHAMWSWYSWLVTFKIFELTYVIQYSRYIHFSCSFTSDMWFHLKISIWPDVVIPSCSTDKSTLLEHILLKHHNEHQCLYCMCRLTGTAMSWEMLGFLTMTIFPWQGSSLAGVEQIMSPTLGTSNGPSRPH